MPKYDVVIAGGGPAGSMAALLLSRAGKKVLVLEKDHFPRPKVCGYSMNPRSWSIWERHGLTDRFKQLPHFTIEGFTLERNGLTLMRHRYRNRGSARTVDRAALDSWLSEEAQASGADYQFGVAVQGLTETSVRTANDEIEAPVVIGADGRNSVVGRLSHLSRPSPPCGRVGWQASIDLPAFDDYVHMNVFPEGYYGINRIDESRINIGITLFLDCKIAVEEILARYLPGIAQISGKTIHPISREPWIPTNGRSWLVGDAAHVMEPFTGEGIYSALATGEMAATHILSIDRIGVKAAARRYQQQHRRFYGWRTFINSVLRWSLSDMHRHKWVAAGLKYLPTSIAPLIEAVQGSENRGFQTDRST